ncbi:MAG: hypothetical protein KDD47_11060 [Acidobacteria bacterium]|nr:hypothetical protein [Acidobacteriota bacterium]
MMKSRRYLCINHGGFPPRVKALAALLGTLFAAACGHGRLTPTQAGDGTAYRQAVADAREARPEEIYRELKPVLAGERGLVWRGEPGESPILVLTWSSWDGYENALGRELTLTRPVWVTLMPELQELCRHTYPRGRKALTRRLERLLGLPPEAGYTRFAELWVDPSDLRRPCPDKEITDRQCSLAFPPSEPDDSDYRRWFESQQESTYGEDGYPWTRLGYTYDWGNPLTEVGLSEYLVWTGATVEVRAVSSLRTFCRP